MFGKTFLAVLKTAGLSTLLPQNEKGQVLCCDHELMRENLKKRAQLLKKTGYVDKDWQNEIREKATPSLTAEKVDWFWNIIDKINWKLDYDVDKAEKRFKALNLSPNEAKEFVRILHVFYDALDNYMTEKFSFCALTPGADDSYSDFIWSAVGSGREFYIKLFSEFYLWPREEIHKTTVESFSYIFGDELYD